MKKKWYLTKVRLNKFLLRDNSLAMGEGYKCYSKCCQLIPTRQVLSDIYSSATSWYVLISLLGIVLGNQKKILPTFSKLFAPLNQDLKFSNNHVNHVRTWNVVEANS